MAKKKKKHKLKNEEGGLVYSTQPETMENIFAGLFDTPAEEEKETPPLSRQKLHTRIERKGRGGKTVTIISNFHGTEEALQKLAKELRQFCGTGGSVKNGEIILQGDCRGRVDEFFGEFSV